MRKLFTAVFLLAATAAGAQTTNPAPYCTGAFGMTQPFINTVSVGTLTNNTAGSASPTGYYYYNNLTAPTLTPGSAYTATISFTFPTVHYVGVFIDYNQNGSFNDPGELVLNKFITNQGQPASPATQSFTVPATATAGQTRMRVIVLEDDDYTFGTQPQPAGPYACVPTPSPSNYQEGQTQDYNVIIGGTAQQAPTATAQAASTVTATSAMLNGIVTANGATTTVSFEYGATTAYGQTVAANPATIAGNVSGTVNALLTGLLPNTTYHYRVKATNSAGTTNSADMTFTTGAPQPLPTVTVDAATNVTGNAATLNGMVNANGAATTVIFEYGTTPNFGQTITATPATVTGNTATPVSALATGLQPSTTYYYRLVATNGGGTVTSTDTTFTTGVFQPKPVVTTYNATSVTGNAATLNGLVIANNDPTTAVFEYGLTNAYGQTANATPAGITGMTPTAVTATITGLLPNKTYHFRLQATNTGGTGAGSNRTFKTSAMGIAELDDEKSFVLAPNPSNGVLRLLQNGGQPLKPVTAIFYNMAGRQALQTRTDADGTLHAEALPAGLYHLCLADDKGHVEVHAVTIQK